MPAVQTCNPSASQQVLHGAIRKATYNESLDGWRGVAILLVFAFHYVPRNLRNPLEFVASLGWSGVDLFFVLSGFLITGILYDSRHSESYFKSFYMRRILRLFPVYLLAVSVVLVGTHMLAGSRSWVYIPFFFYGANIVLGFPGAHINFLPHFACSHFWSLALEEQFYSIWPFVVFFVPRRRTLMLLCAAGIPLALSVRIALLLAHAPAWLAFAELPARMDSLLAGAILALGLRSARRQQWLRPVVYRLVFLASVLALILAIWVSKSVSFMSPSMSTVGHTALAAMGTCVLALALISNTLTSRVGKITLLRFYGRYSYGIYVWHFLPKPMVDSLVFPAIDRIPSLLLAESLRATVLLALFTGVAVASYHLFEVHFLRMKSRFHRSPQVSVADQFSTAE